MLNQKQFGCLKFLSVNLMTHNWKIKKQKFSLFAKQKFPAKKNDIQDTGPDTDHGPDMGFYGPLVNQSEERILKSHIIKIIITHYVYYDHYKYK
jgi:hypothetical protein